LHNKVLTVNTNARGPTPARSPVLKLAVGRAHQAHWLVYVFAVLFLARYVWLSK
jgi:hypothetical protein